MLPRPKLILTAMTGARLGKEIRRISYLPWYFGARWCWGVDFPANVVHFELVCSNHKFRICQIAIVNCSIKVCIQQMLHGLKKQYRSVSTKVQESYHNLFFTKPLGSLGPFKWQDSLSPYSPSDRPSPRIFLFNLILLLLTDNSLLLKMFLLLWSPSQIKFSVLCPVFCRRFENGCNLSPDWRWFVGKVMIANISCHHESDCRHFLTSANLWSKSQDIFSTSQTFKKGKIYIWGKKMVLKLRYYLVREYLETTTVLLL